jgi:GAF domain-containing protein
LENTFGKNIIPSNEDGRLSNLEKYKIIYSQPETVFNELAALAATLHQVPIAMINFIDKDQVWTKADQAGKDGAQVERGSSLCSLAILKESVTVFEDTLKEPVLISNPMVAGEFGLRFYAAAPITTKDGFNIGVVCILDKESRKFTKEDQEKLAGIARMVEVEIEKRISGQ